MSKIHPRGRLPRSPHRSFRLFTRISRSVATLALLVLVPVAAVVAMTSGQAWLERVTGMPTPQERLENALLSGDEAGIREMLRAGARMDRPNPWGIPPLCQAAMAGHLGGTRRALAEGVDVNVRDTSGRTALSYAVGHESVELVCILLDAGADPLVADNEGHDARWWARERGAPPEILALLGMHGSAAG